MINLLMGLHAGEQFLPDMTIDPTDIKVHIGDWFNNKIPLELLGNMLDDSILGLYDEKNSYQKHS